MIFFFNYYTLYIYLYTVYCIQYISYISAIGNAYLQEMNKMNLQGEVTFLPLDRLQARREDYPSAPDALPLIDKINYAEGLFYAQDFKVQLKFQ